MCFIFSTSCFARACKYALLTLGFPVASSGLSITTWQACARLRATPSGTISPSSMLISVTVTRYTPVPYILRYIDQGCQKEQILGLRHPATPFYDERIFYAPPLH
jgi:hypothetical protein